MDIGYAHMAGREMKVERSNFNDNERYNQLPYVNITQADISNTFILEDFSGFIQRKCDSIDGKETKIMYMAATYIFAAFSMPEMPIDNQPNSVASVLVNTDGRIIAWACKTGGAPNQLKGCQHGETNMIRKMYAKGKKIPEGAYLFTNLQPCKMCAGIIHTCCPSLKVIYHRPDIGDSSGSGREEGDKDTNKLFNGLQEEKLDDSNTFLGSLYPKKIKGSIVNYMQKILREFRQEFEARSSDHLGKAGLRGHISTQSIEKAAHWEKEGGKWRKKADGDRKKIVSFSMYFVVYNILRSMKCIGLNQDNENFRNNVLELFEGCCVR